MLNFPILSNSASTAFLTLLFRSSLHRFLLDLLLFHLFDFSLARSRLLGLTRNLLIGLGGGLTFRFQLIQGRLHELMVGYGESEQRDSSPHLRDGRFREDLLYRLNVITLHLPPLRERSEDILTLADLEFLAALLPACNLLL